MVMLPQRIIFFEGKQLCFFVGVKIFNVDIFRGCCLGELWETK